MFKYNGLNCGIALGTNHCVEERDAANGSKREVY